VPGYKGPEPGYKPPGGAKTSKTTKKGATGGHPMQNRAAGDGDDDKSGDWVTEPWCKDEVDHDGKVRLWDDGGWGGMS
jgi:hypothetical protein